MLWHTGKPFRHAVRIVPLLARDRSTREDPRRTRPAPGFCLPPMALAVLLGSVAVTGSPARARDAAVAPKPADAPSPAEGPQALIASLRSRILAAHSATFALESWCADYKLAGDPHLVAERVAVADKPLTAAQRARLAIGPDEPVRYRRVRLACGDRVLSEADNWYVPARLTPEMNATLDSTRTPFGRVVRPLAPVRNTVEVRAPVQSAAPGPNDPLFEIDAVLSTGAGQPFCEVVETYLGGALPQASR
ncbi:hypothetical protein R1A27_21985 [Methylobacterium sp. NMS12]|uniref:hypothetical protein n=1 Tax=Methylobacterium sp. NMS12 TaxID=3079766 RepID=UPI003F880E0E